MPGSGQAASGGRSGSGASRALPRMPSGGPGTFLEAEAARACQPEMAPNLQLRYVETEA